MAKEEHLERNSTAFNIHNIPDELMSSVNSDNFNMDMISSTSDGLSEKENIVQLMKTQMRASSNLLTATVRNLQIT